MGKKNKKAKSVSAEAESGMPRHVRREVLEIVNQLLESEHLGLSSRNISRIHVIIMLFVDTAEKSPDHFHGENISCAIVRNPISPSF